MITTISAAPPPMTPPIIALVWEFMEPREEVKEVEGEEEVVVVTSIVGTV